MATSQDQPRHDSPFLVKQFSRHFSRNSSSSVGDDYSFQDELEFLQNVYYDDLQVSNQGEPYCTLLFQITPSTADDKDKQFVYIEATITVDRKYPKTKPMIELSKSRGLVDSHLNSISLGVAQMATERLGTPVIYDLIEYIRDCLTNNNRPYGLCVLCQFEFQDIDEFIRTQCYHYFHPECLIHYVHYCETTEEEVFDPTIMKPKLTMKKLECPVCRVPLKKKLLNISEADNVDIKKEQISNNLFQPSESLLAWQKEMAVLYKRQQDNGGIITNTDDDVIDNDTWVSTRGELNNEQQQQQLDELSSSPSKEVSNKDETAKPEVIESVNKEEFRHSDQQKNRYGNRYHGNRSRGDRKTRTQKEHNEGKLEDRKRKPDDKHSKGIIIVQDGGRRRDNTNYGSHHKRHHYQHHRQPRNNNSRPNSGNKEGNSADHSKPTRNQSEKRSTSIETRSNGGSTTIEIQLPTK